MVWVMQHASSCDENGRGRPISTVGLKIGYFL
jgi:hypothetical protein